MSNVPILVSFPLNWKYVSVVLLKVTYLYPILVIDPSAHTYEVSSSELQENDIVNFSGKPNIFLTLNQCLPVYNIFHPHT